MIENVTEMAREFISWAGLKVVVAGGITFALELVGYPESAILWLFYLMVADFILGFSRAWKNGTPNRRKFYKGIGKFLFYGVSVALLVFVDRSLSVAFKADYLPYELQDFYIAYLCIGEFVSCAGHLAFFGMPFPASFLRRLEQYRQRIEGEGWDGKERRQNAQNERELGLENNSGD
jgi:toxin secretion/phage lysis holin